MKKHNKGILSFLVSRVCLGMHFDISGIEILDPLNSSCVRGNMEDCDKT